MEAETVFVQQTLIDPKIVSRFRSEIARWDRFDVVASADDADLIAGTRRIRADVARRLLGQVEALLAEHDLLLQAKDRLTELRRELVGRAEDEIRQSGRRLLPDPRKPTQRLNEAIDGSELP